MNRIASPLLIAALLCSGHLQQSRVHPESQPLSMVVHSVQWRTWERTKARQLVSLAHLLQQTENRESTVRATIIEDLISRHRLSEEYLDATEERPDHSHSSAMLREALALDPYNLLARCLLAQNLLDNVYVGEGAYDSQVIDQQLLPQLNWIVHQVQLRRLQRPEGRAVQRLRTELHSYYEDNLQLPEWRSFRIWWRAHAKDLTNKTVTGN